MILAVLFSSMSMPVLVRDIARMAQERQIVDAPDNNIDAQPADAFHVEQTTFGHQRVNTGETLTLSYHLINISDRIIASVQINDPALGVVSAQLLALEPGESAVFSKQFSMDATEKHSTPILIYRFEGEATVYTKKLESTDFYAEAGVAATLQVNPIAYAGDRVDFNYTIVNATDEAITDIRITDGVLGDIETNLSLNPGRTHLGTKSVTITDTVTFQLTVTGIDVEGNQITFMSKEATVQTVGPIE